MSLLLNEIFRLNFCVFMFYYYVYLFFCFRYEGNRLTVSHDVDNKRTWKSCFTVDGVYLPTGYYFGVSAATGDLSDNHDVTGLKTYELDTPESKDERADILPNAQFVSAPRDHTEDPPPAMSGLKKFFMFLLGVLGKILFSGG